MALQQAASNGPSGLILLMMAMTWIVVMLGLIDDTPHWMASLHHLTEDTVGSSSTAATGNTFGLAPGASPLQPSGSSSWMMPSQMMSSRVLPPGFGLSASASATRPNQTADAQMLGDRQLSAS